MGRGKVEASQSRTVGHHHDAGHRRTEVAQEPRGVARIVMDEEDKAHGLLLGWKVLLLSSAQTTRHYSLLNIVEMSPR